jgi:long-subunit acyl-CoA synthetase (AMP-forming)
MLQNEAEIPHAGPGAQEPTVCAAFQATAREHADRVALRAFGSDVALTWAQYARRVESLTAGLAALGLEHQETLALQLSNRPEFHTVDMAALHLGAIPFSVYNTSSPQQICQRLQNSGARIAVTEHAFLEVMREAAEQYGGLEHLVVVDGPAEGALSLEGVIERGEEAFDFGARWRSVAPQDIVTLIYTSGTTGPPKAAQLTHHAVMATLRSLDQVLPLPKKAMVSLLPMAHIAERMWTHYMPLAYGAMSHCCADRTQAVACMRETRPDAPFQVPRFWEKSRSVLLANIDGLEDQERRAALKDAIDTGLLRIRAEQAGEPVAPEVVEAHERAKPMLKSVCLEPLGLDHVEAAFVGGAPCPRGVVEFFRALGLPIFEAYGLTETCGFAGIFPRRGESRIGTVGRPVPGVELRLADDNEILLRSDMNMVGYRNQPAQTREAIDEDGWLHTGDIGEVDAEGYVKIVDRKKDLIINAYGKNMSPVVIEEAIREESTLIGPTVAVGDGRPYNVALVTLDPEAAAGFAARRGLDPSAPALAVDERVLAEVHGAIERGNQRLSRTEQIRAFKVLQTEWQPDSEELTPTMKLKRKAIAQKYAAEIEALYRKPADQDAA